MTVLYDLITHLETLFEVTIASVILIQITESYSDTLITVLFQGPEKVVTQ